MDMVDASDRSLLVRLDGGVAAAVEALEADPIPGVLNLHPAEASILVVYDPLATDPQTLREQVAQRAARAAGSPVGGRVVEIPVVYDGPDLADVAELHGLTPAQAAELHASALYEVGFLGFLPGFAYLTGLPESLATPRLEAPRTLVPAGSVGIGGRYTAVYPVATPGGWRLIGRTPEQMFRLDRPGYSLLHIGDRVRFVPVCA